MSTNPQPPQILGALEQGLKDEGIPCVLTYEDEIDYIKAGKGVYQTTRWSLLSRGSITILQNEHQIKIIDRYWANKDSLEEHTIDLQEPDSIPHIIQILKTNYAHDLTAHNDFEIMQALSRCNNI